MPQLIPELTYYADLVVDDVGAGPFGARLIYNVTGGEFVGDRMKGSIVGAGADWLLFGADGFGRLDVRATFRTHDDALIYVQYHGLIEATEGITAILEGGGAPTEYGDQYFFTHPRMETGDERYAYVNTSFFIGQGRLVPGPRVEYQVFRIVN
ncbi:MAG TPA: DUF3237 domain-containing protein [Acidimicrobiales bacterium]|jgi:hypothetical protein